MTSLLKDGSSVLIFDNEGEYPSLQTNVQVEDFIKQRKDDFAKQPEILPVYTSKYFSHQQILEIISSYLNKKYFFGKSPYLYLIESNRIDREEATHKIEYKDNKLYISIYDRVKDRRDNAKQYLEQTEQKLALIIGDIPENITNYDNENTIFLFIHDLQDIAHKRKRYILNKIIILDFDDYPLIVGNYMDILHELLSIYPDLLFNFIIFAEGYAFKCNLTITDLYFLTKLLKLRTNKPLVEGSGKDISRLIFDKQGVTVADESLLSKLNLYVKETEMPEDNNPDTTKHIIIRSTSNKDKPGTTHVIYTGGIGKIIKNKGFHEYYCIIPFFI